MTSTGAKSSTIEPAQDRSLIHTVWKMNKIFRERVKRNIRQTLPARDGEASSCRQYRGSQSSECMF